jgi:hypothetical protein
MAQNVDPIVKGVIENSIRAALHVDGLDERHPGGETVAGFGGDGRVRAGVGNLAGRLERVQIKHGDTGGVASARNV